MNEASDFLEAIWANPNDDLPRLVFADWLEEHGEDEHARHIRLSYELEKREPSHPVRRRALRHERHQLRVRLKERWGEIAPGVSVDGCVDFQGRVNPLRLDTAAFLAWDREWPIFLSRRRIHLLDYHGREDDLVNCSKLCDVADLAFSGSSGGINPVPPHEPKSDPLLRALERGTCLTNLARLRVVDLCPSRRGLAAFARSSLVSRLADFSFDFPDDPIRHDWVEVNAIQPPAGAIRAAIERFASEYAEMLPET